MTIYLFVCLFVFVFFLLLLFVFSVFFFVLFLYRVDFKKDIIALSVQYITTCSRVTNNSDYSQKQAKIFLFRVAATTFFLLVDDVVVLSSWL